MHFPNTSGVLCMPMSNVHTYTDSVLLYIGLYVTPTYLQTKKYGISRTFASTSHLYVLYMYVILYVYQIMRVVISVRYRYYTESVYTTQHVMRGTGNVRMLLYASTAILRKALRYGYSYISIHGVSCSCTSSIVTGSTVAP